MVAIMAQCEGDNQPGLQKQIEGPLREMRCKAIAEILESPLRNQHFPNSTRQAPE